ncbi:MvaI/BcnI family restriction endonuclease [Duganella sp. S19_KUP01_CR8]|uniref:MvaI/BcnI family restriction endonuclease n=1 Tax=Duganella sp. S19_KUP01_CR8 TaxID=3025502 RepID=UPI002FCDD4C8
MSSPSTGLPSEFEHHIHSVLELKTLLSSIGADLALLKVLPKNANDKNQIYIASDFGVIFDLFRLTLSERGESTSLTKDHSLPGKRISEAVFDDFAWLRRDGAEVKARRLKAIIYTQYPEARLSGLQTIEGTIPASLSVNFTKSNPDAKRLLVLARLPRGKCIGFVCLDMSADFEVQLKALPGFERAPACKRLSVEQNRSDELERRLASIVDQPIRGCRLDAFGQTLPFSGTQVCGYTLEHALGIVPNSNKDGDLFGIELKTHTNPKVTLFTPEPDGGAYTQDFAAFMTTYGYKDTDGDYRLTGLHRADAVCSKSGLTLRVREKRLDADGVVRSYPYNPDTPLTPKLDSVDVALIGPAGEVAASWSLERLMNCWGAKHNEVVYIPAIKDKNPNTVEHDQGFEHLITFGAKVMWCRDTTAENLLKAIKAGVIYLDPAPKLHASDPAKNKRRAQWRVNDITKAAEVLYARVEFRQITPNGAVIKSAVRPPLANSALPQGLLFPN